MRIVNSAGVPKYSGGEGRFSLFFSIRFDKSLAATTTTPSTEHVPVLLPQLLHVFSTFAHAVRFREPRLSFLPPCRSLHGFVHQHKVVHKAHARFHTAFGFPRVVFRGIPLPPHFEIRVGLLNNRVCACAPTTARWTLEDWREGEGGRILFLIEPRKHAPTLAELVSYPETVCAT